MLANGGKRCVISLSLSLSLSLTLYVCFWIYSIFSLSLSHASMTPDSSEWCFKGYCVTFALHLSHTHRFIVSFFFCVTQYGDSFCVRTFGQKYIFTFTPTGLDWLLNSSPQHCLSSGQAMKAMQWRGIPADVFLFFFLFVLFQFPP